MPDPKSPDSRPDALAAFLKEAEGFVTTTVDGITKAVGKDDDAPLIASHGAALTEQMGKLVQLTRERYEGANAESRRLVDDFMNAQSVTTLARNAQSTLRASVAKGIFGDGFFSWLESNQAEIKKIFEMIFSLFGAVPAWLTKILQIIDQLLKLLSGLFGGILGRNRSRIMSELSIMEVEFWNEIAAHKRYLLAANGGANDAED